MTRFEKWTFMEIPCRRVEETNEVKQSQTKNNFSDAFNHVWLSTPPSVMNLEVALKKWPLSYHVYHCRYIDTLTSDGNFSTPLRGYCFVLNCERPLNSGRLSTSHFWHTRVCLEYFSQNYLSQYMLYLPVIFIAPRKKIHKNIWQQWKWPIIMISQKSCNISILVYYFIISFVAIGVRQFLTSTWIKSKNWRIVQPMLC